MAIDPVTAAAIAKSLIQVRQGKITRAAQGEQSFTTPKTLFGKIIGGVSGRTAAAKETNMLKSNPISPKVMGAMSQRQGTPVTGGISFGGQAYRMTYLPFIIVAAVVAIFYSMRRRRGTRRR